MPSKKGIEQALTWLGNKAQDKNTLDGVNAELCINVIMDLQRQYDKLCVQFGAVKKHTSQKPVFTEPQISLFENEVKD